MAIVSVAPDAAERNDLVLLDGLGRNQLDDGRVDVELREIDGGNAVLLAQELGDFFVGDEAESDQIQSDLAAVGLLMVQRFLQLGRCDALFFEQQLADTNGHRVRPCVDRNTAAGAKCSRTAMSTQGTSCWGEL